MKRSDFTFDLPEKLIAQTPCENRSASRLLVLNTQTKTVSDQLFSDLPSLINPGDLMIMNNTRVIRARLFGHKSTGGKVEILIERVLDQSRAVAQIKASKAPKPESRIELDQKISAVVLQRHDDLFELEFSQDIHTVMESIGHIPLPPYIERQDTAEDSERYQTVYARNKGAIAAPTAGLHFDQPLLDQLEQGGVNIGYVTLHVGAGTFQSVRVKNVEEHTMHSEWFEVTPELCDQIKKTRQTGGKVIAVGTTTVRALESALRQAGKNDEILPCNGDTDIFIYPGYEIKTIDALITNFHLPESTLLMLISALAGTETIKKTYQHAIEQEYRFFSYGDAMYIQKE